MLLSYKVDVFRKIVNNVDYNNLFKKKSLKHLLIFKNEGKQKIVRILRLSRLLSFTRDIFIYLCVSHSPGRQTFFLFS